MNYSRAAKRRAKKALPELAATPKRGKDKCFVERTRQQADDPNPEQTVLEARARQSGKPETDEMRYTAYGEAAGMAISAIHGGDTAKRLWDVYRACSGAYERFHRVCLGKSVHAKTAKLEMMPEIFQVDPSHTYDDRSEDERHRAAQNKWRDWRDALNAIGLRHSSEIYSAMHGWSNLMDDGKVTKAGRRFVVAVEKLEGECSG